MRKLSVLFLKMAIVLVSLPVLILGGYGLYWLMGNPVNPIYAPMLYPMIAGIYLAIIPLIWNLYLLYRLLDQISKTDERNVKQKLLKSLRKGSLLFGGVFLVIQPFVFLVAQEDDAPGLILFFMIPVLFALVMSAVFTIFIENGDEPRMIHT